MKNKIVELENGTEYCIIEEVNFEGVAYVYAIDIKNAENIAIFAVVDGEFKVPDNDLAKKILLMFYEKIK